jgi:hypothetical protein
MVILKIYITRQLVRNTYLLKKVDQADNLGH